MAQRRSRRVALFLVAGIVVGLTGNGVTSAAFNAEATNQGNSFSAAPDWVAPSADRSVVANEPPGFIPGFVRPGGTYRVYANVTDSGNPPSGTAAVTANVAALTTGQTAHALASGSATVGGLAYTHGSTAALTVGTGVTAGVKTYSLTATDAAVNTGTQTGYTVTVDGTAPTPTDVQTANKTGGTAGSPEVGDTVTYTFSEGMEPYSFLAGWTGATTNVVVRLNNVKSSDTITIFNAGNSTQLPFGLLDVKRQYTSANVTFGATGTPSTITRNGATITVILGTASGPVATQPFSGSMVWTPSTSPRPTDPAGNLSGTSQVTESGTNDVEF